jgi:hypothetical protein
LVPSHSYLRRHELNRDLRSVLFHSSMGPLTHLRASSKYPTDLSWTRGSLSRGEVCVSLSVSLSALTLFSFLVLILLNDWESEGSNSRTRSQMAHSQLSLALSELQARISSVLLLSREATAATARTVTSSAKSSRSSVSSTAATATAEILDCVGFIYSNDCNAAFKVKPLLSSLFSPPLSPRC